MSEFRAVSGFLVGESSGLRMTLHCNITLHTLPDTPKSQHPYIRFGLRFSGSLELSMAVVPSPSSLVAFKVAFR